MAGGQNIGKSQAGSSNQIAGPAGARVQTGKINKNSIAIAMARAQKQAKTHRESLKEERLWEYLDISIRARAIAGICDAVETDHAGRVRLFESLYLFMWTAAGVAAWFFGWGIGSAAAVATGLVMHVRVFLNPQLPYGEHFEGVHGWETRRKFLVKVDTLCPRRESGSNLEHMRGAVLGGDLGNVPARCLGWGEAELLGVTQWLEAAGGPGGVDMAKILAKQEHNKDATLGDILSIIRRIGGGPR